MPLADERPPLQDVSRMEVAVEDSVGGGAEGDRETEDPVGGRDLLADERCGQMVLDFLSSTDMGRLVPPLEESDATSEVSERELRERRERKEERDAEAEELGTEGEAGEELLLFLPTP